MGNGPDLQQNGLILCFTSFAMLAAVYTDGSRKDFPVSLLHCHLYEARSRMDSVLAWDTTREIDARQRTSSLGPKKTNATRLGGTSREGSDRGRVGENKHRKRLKGVGRGSTLVVLRTPLSEIPEICMYTV